MNRVVAGLHRLVFGGVPLWYHPHYRLPAVGVESRVGIEPRRADHVVTWLLDAGVIHRDDLRTPARASWGDLGRVHAPDWLESLTRAETLARVFGVDPWGLPVDEVLDTVRLACGGTVAAAREALTRDGPAVNLLGGFHHARPDGGGGLCPVNDVAVAVAMLAADGWTGRVAVLDVDAHPPDGTAACLGGAAWIGSLSGSDWGPLPGVDEHLLAPGTDDGPYLEALDALLARMPEAELTFVLAGGDVVIGDRLGRLAVSEAGVRERDRRIATRLQGRPSVWLPGGGYQERSWRVLAGTVLEVIGLPRMRIPPGYDPLKRRFEAIAAGLPVPGPDGDLSDRDLAVALGLERPRPERLLGYYTPQAVELALERYGVLPHLVRLGYSGFQVEFDANDTGERLRLFGEARGARHLLVEAVVERTEVDGRPVLYLHWLTLRHPLGAFHPRRPVLPGQEVPGLGLAPEAMELCRRIAERLNLDGVAWRPAHYHVAWATRKSARFVDPARQGRFEALVRDTEGLPLDVVSRAVDQGRVRLDGRPYAWEADLVVDWRVPHPEDAEAVAAAREAARFTVDPG